MQDQKVTSQFINSIPKGFYRISIKALVLDEQQRFLLVKKENGMWEFPGGGINYDETPKETLMREIKEEMGIEVQKIANSPLYFITFFSENKVPFANVFYITKLTNLNFIPSNECKELGFFTKEEALKKDIHGNVKKFLDIYSPLK